MSRVKVNCGAVSEMWLLYRCCQFHDHVHFSRSSSSASDIKNPATNWWVDEGPIHTAGQNPELPSHWCRCGGGHLSVRLFSMRQLSVGECPDIDVQKQAQSRQVFTHLWTWKWVVFVIKMLSPFTVMSKCLCSRFTWCYFVLTDKPDETDDVKQVELRVPRVTRMQNALSSSEYSLFQLFSLPVRLFGYRSKMSPTLWMLSVYFAEIEKHKGDTFHNNHHLCKCASVCQTSHFQLFSFHQMSS